MCYLGPVQLWAGAACRPARAETLGAAVRVVFLDIESSFLTQVTCLPLHIRLAVTLRRELEAKETHKQIREDFKMKSSKLTWATANMHEWLQMSYPFNLLKPEFYI